MATTCCSITGLVFLVLTNLCLILAFATPYWVVLQRISRGLWAYCGHATCTWVFQEAPYYLPEQDSAWWMATQGLMCVGLGLTMFALLVATVALCCQCKGCNSSHIVSGILLLAFLVVGVAVVVFGLSANKYLGVEVGTFKRFAWSFWMAAASSGLSFFTAAIYAVDGRPRYS